VKTFLLVFIMSLAYAQVLPPLPSIDELVPLPAIPETPLPSLPSVPGLPSLDDLPFPFIIPDLLGNDGQKIIDDFLECQQNASDPTSCFARLLENIERLFAGFAPVIPALEEAEQTAGYIDFVEESEAEHWAVRLPSIHIGVTEEYFACQDHLLNCETNFILTTIYLSKEAAEHAQEEIDEAWETFIKTLADDVDQAINQDPPCFVGGRAPTCPEVLGGNLPIPEPSCVARRVSQALADYLPQRNTEYWEKVLEALATYLPNTILWGATKAPFTVAIAPVVDVPKPNQYFAGFTSDPREYLYYLQTLQALGYPVMPGELLEGDIQEGLPGLVPLEAAKDDFEAASSFEYQEVGFSSFYELWPVTVWELIWDEGFLVSKPGVDIYCWLIVKVPLPPFKIPVPVYAPAVKAVTEYVSVSEGYSIPRLEGSPWTRPSY
jgi:hypothetical protein